MAANCAFRPAGVDVSGHREIAIAALPSMRRRSTRASVASPPNDGWAAIGRLAVNAPAPSSQNLYSSFRRVLLGRVKRRALPSAQSLLRKLDQVPGDKAHTEDGLDLTTAQRVPGRLPERCSVVGYNPDSPDNIPSEHSAALQIELCQLTFCRQAQSVRIGCVNLIAEPGEKPLRRVGMCDRAAPARQHFGARAKEFHVRNPDPGR